MSNGARQLSAETADWRRDHSAKGRAS